MSFPKKTMSFLQEYHFKSIRMIEPTMIDVYMYMVQNTKKEKKEKKMGIKGESRS